MEPLYEMFWRTRDMWCMYRPQRSCSRFFGDLAIGDVRTAHGVLPSPCMSFFGELAIGDVCTAHSVLLGPCMIFFGELAMGNVCTAHSVLLSRVGIHGAHV